MDPLAGARQVAELITGLKDLGCKRATGEDQTVCVMSDSFNVRGFASDLQDSGDLPNVEVVKVGDVGNNLTSTLPRNACRGVFVKRITAFVNIVAVRCDFFC